MAVEAAIAFATFLLEDDHLVALYEGKENFACYLCAFYGRHTDSHVAVGVKKKDFVEDYSLAFLYFIAEMVHIQILAFFGFELLTFDFYDCVHFNLLYYWLLRWARSPVRLRLEGPWREMQCKIIKKIRPDKVFCVKINKLSASHGVLWRCGAGSGGSVAEHDAVELLVLYEETVVSELRLELEISGSVYHCGQLPHLAGSEDDVGGDSDHDGGAFDACEC